MKYIILCMLFFGLISCSTNSLSTNKDIEQTEEESDEWQVTVFDAEYENFVQTRARPMSFYSESLLISRNRLLVTEWNTRVFNSNYDSSIYEMAIDYDNTEVHGLEFEYRLYQFFVFVSWKFNQKFNGVRQSDLF